MTTDVLNGTHALKHSVKGDVVLPADPAYRRCSTNLERDGRPPARRDRALR